MFTSDSGFLAPFLSHLVPWLYMDSFYWTIVGYVASILFSARFVIQWYLSEKHKQIIIPASFWYLSLVGSILQLIYLCHVDKAPLILSYVCLPFINARSLIIHLREDAGKK